MRTWKITISPTNRKDAVLCSYFADNTTDARCMYNAANFYIRNTMTGIKKKSPEQRSANEAEVLSQVSDGIRKANAAADERMKKQFAACRAAGGMASAVKASKLQVKHFSVPTPEHWFLSYETLDASSSIPGIRYIRE